ncbi:hypothetical protein [Sphingomonas flavalba]|uniref:hypothetical protein n=1 Tax=Sphingomonas flavalba TaxID=2559804 RepID=UPI0014465643|nr:hypothetical protein [Sphingomonas flavalba]
MVDPIEVRMWSDNHVAFSRQVEQAIRGFWRKYQVAHAHVYRAPWRGRTGAR